MSFEINVRQPRYIKSNHPMVIVFRLVIIGGILLFIFLVIIAKLHVQLTEIFGGKEHMGWYFEGIFGSIDKIVLKIMEMSYGEMVQISTFQTTLYFVSYIFLVWEWNRRCFEKLTLIKWVSNLFTAWVLMFIPFLPYVFMAYGTFRLSLLLFREIKLISRSGIKLNLSKVDHKKDLKIRIPTNKGMLRIDNLFRNIWLLAGPGSGKTNLLRFLVRQLGQKDFALILYDFKFPSLAFDVANAYKDSKVMPYYLSFSDVSRSCRLNPILPENMTSSAHAIENANVIMSNLVKGSREKDNFFDRSATMLLAATLWYLREEHPQFCTIPHAVSMIQHRKFQEVIIKQMCEDNLEVEGMIVSIVTALENKAGNQTAGVISTLQNAMARLNLPQIFWVLTDNELSLDLNNPDEPKALVLGNEGELDAVFSPILALIYTVALKKMNKRGMYHSCSLIDEGYTIYIPDYAKYPSTSRENKLAHIFSAQDYSQVEEKWGEKEAEILAGVFSSHAYGKTTNHRSMERIQKMFGRGDEKYLTRSHGTNKPSFPSRSDSSSSNTISESIQERDRVKIQHIKDMKSGELIGFLAEGNTVEFKCRVKEFKDEKSIQELPSREVTDEMIKDNFKRVRKDIDSIIKNNGEVKTTVSEKGSKLELNNDIIKRNGEDDGRGLEV